MKKKSIVILIIIIGLILLIPIPMKLKDGGSIEFKAILYTITKYHRLTVEEDGEAQYIDGIGIEILGMEVYNNTDKSEVKERKISNTKRNYNKLNTRRWNKRRYNMVWYISTNMEWLKKWLSKTRYCIYTTIKSSRELK